MKTFDQIDWDTVVNTATLNLGPVSIFCYESPITSYRFKVGSWTSEPKYKTLEAAQNASLRYVEKLCSEILDAVRAMPDYEKLRLKKGEADLDSWHVSILDLGK